ncbi:MAG: hypothetical protein AVDCRST_MAG93-9408, partial [uncultured Chloroflexia bacterium]
STLWLVRMRPRLTRRRGPWPIAGLRKLPTSVLASPFTQLSFPPPTSKPPSWCPVCAASAMRYTPRLPDGWNRLHATTSPSNAAFHAMSYSERSLPMKSTRSTSLRPTASRLRSIPTIRYVFGRQLAGNMPSPGCWAFRRVTFSAAHATRSGPPSRHPHGGMNSLRRLTD